jgi:hypothetical protein
VPSMDTTSSLVSSIGRSSTSASGQQVACDRVDKIRRDHSDARQTHTARASERLSNEALAR